MIGVGGHFFFVSQVSSSEGLIFWIFVFEQVLCMYL